MSWCLKCCWSSPWLQAATVAHKLSIVLVPLELVRSLLVNMWVRVGRWRQLCKRACLMTDRVLVVCQRCSFPVVISVSLLFPSFSKSLISLHYDSCQSNSPALEKYQQGFYRRSPDFNAPEPPSACAEPSVLESPALGGRDQCPTVPTPTIRSLCS